MQLFLPSAIAILCCPRSRRRSRHPQDFHHRCDLEGQPLRLPVSSDPSLLQQNNAANNGPPWSSKKHGCHVTDQSARRPFCNTTSASFLRRSFLSNAACIGSRPIVLSTASHRYTQSYRIKASTTPVRRILSC